MVKAGAEMCILIFAMEWHHCGCFASNTLTFNSMVKRFLDDYLQ